MKLDFEIEGLAELEKQLLSLEAKVGLKTLRSASRKAMQPVLDSAKAGAKEDTGDMKASLAIRTRRPKKSKVTAVSAEVGSFKRTFKNTDGSKRKINRQDAKVAAQEYGVRGIPAQPFLRPALENNATAVLDIFKTELAKAIEKAVKKVSK